MDSSKPPEAIRRARRVYAAGIGVLAVLASMLLLSGDGSVLRPIGVQAMTQPWADARTLSGAGVALDLGLDPMISNPGDPWGRRLNYPRIWLVLAKLGLRPEHTLWLASAFLLAALAGFAALIRLVSDRRCALILLLAVFAPTTWLAIERANSDLLLFGLGAFAATLAASRPIASGALIAAATALKLYPIAGLLALVTERRRNTLLLTLPIVALFIAYLISLGDDLDLMKQGTMRAQQLSYGMSALPAWFASQTEMPLWSLLLIAAGVMAGVFAFSVHWRLRLRLGATGSKAELAAFRLGAAVYLTSFIAGANFDYRLMFLVLAVPQLCAWSRGPAWLLKRGAWLVLGALLLTLWAFTWRYRLERFGMEPTIGISIDEWLSWALWSGMLCFTVVSLPDWLLPIRLRGAPFADGVASLPTHTDTRELLEGPQPQHDPQYVPQPGRARPARRKPTA